jgi:hypothetical protein
MKATGEGTISGACVIYKKGEKREQNYEQVQSLLIDMSKQQTNLTREIEVIHVPEVMGAAGEGFRIRGAYRM